MTVSNGNFHIESSKHVGLDKKFRRLIPEIDPELCQYAYAGLLESLLA